VSDTTNHVLRVERLTKHFPVGGGFLAGPPAVVHAVDGISFDIDRSETFGLVGESGCGKTTTGRMVLRLIRPTSGKVYFKGENIFGFNAGGVKSLRRNMQIVFQDAYSSFDPRRTAGDIVEEPLRVHSLGTRQDRPLRVRELFHLVGLQPELANEYPHSLSSGQKQCVGIARALAVHPEFIVCDEPVSNLDVSVRAQVLNLLKKLQDEMGLTYLFIAHDMSVIKFVSTRVAVMYLGLIVELALRRELFAEPLHPYTQALLAAVPVPNPRMRTRRALLEGDVPSPINPPPGCRFHTRCPRVMPVCKEVEPELKEVAAGHLAACHKL